MKLTKKAALAANDEIQGTIGFKPALDTTLKVGDLYKELYKKVLEVKIDDEDREGFADETCEVIDALAEMFPNITLNKKGEAVEDNDEAEAPEEKPEKKEKKSKKGKKDKKEKEVEVVEEAEVVEEKPAKKTKGKKAKAPKEVVEEVVAEKPAKKAKGKKGKKSDLASMDDKELREHMKSMKKPEIIEMIDADPILSAKADELKAIKNFMSFKKAIGDVLKGEEIEVAEPKARTKKEKVVELTLSEAVEAAADLDTLKAIAKVNKESFPGVKAKKFDKVKKLRKAMLAVIVESAPKKRKGKTSGANLETVRAERQKRIDWITDFINDAGGSVGRKKLTAKALEKFPNPAKAIRDMISYAKNPKYNKFDKLMVEVDGVIGWEGSVKAAKPEKKAKGKKAPKEEAAPEPVKKEKKGKKDKKNKKGKKSKK